MNKLSKVIALLFWILVLAVFFKYQLYQDGIHKIVGFLKTYPHYSELLFLIIGSLRIFTLVPCTVLIMIAGMVFSPVEAFLLAGCANLLSESILFLFVKMTTGSSYQEKLIRRHQTLFQKIQKNHVKILALGVSSPVVPSDLVCLFSVLAGISFQKYILTIFWADTPVILLYTFLGASVRYSILLSAAIAGIIVIVSFVQLKKWNHVQNGQECGGNEA